ncbi:MAG: dihydrodipicolinate synthase family protein [Anaerolineae bacterium]|jgi:dihydrodipicolinate synthase/N-acetylneuraminate lyase|nr:dihydrodipicolinate synthase family protein [Chloroflexota bacterium]
MIQPWRGIFAIANTPFDGAGHLLWDELDVVFDWVIRAGAHGLVWPVMASEFTSLTTEERIRGTQRAVEVAAGRVPVVIGVADVCTDGAVALARAAARFGADGVIAMPPWATHMPAHLIPDYYRALAQASELPIVVQNAGPPLGSSLPWRSVVALCEEIPQVQYLKEEKVPQGQSLSEVIDAGSPAVRGVFSGNQCMWLMADHARGACGCMPASHMVDVDVRIWELLERGDLAQAEKVHRDKMVLENAVTSMRGGWLSAKEVLRRRGVISSAAIRNQGPLYVDPVESAVLDLALKTVSPHMTAHI